MKEQIGTGNKKDGLYYFAGNNSIHHVSVSSTTSLLELWHKRLGHPSEKIVKLLPLLCNHKGSLDPHCETCFRSKHSRSNSKASRIFEKIHCNLWGPYRHVSSNGARYFLTIVDDYSRAVWTYLLVDKVEVLSMFMSFVAMVQCQFSQTIKIVQSDNGTEFRCLLDFLLHLAFCFIPLVSALLRKMGESNVNTNTF